MNTNKPSSFDIEQGVSGRHGPVLFSTTCAYAVRAMSHLARLSKSGYVRVQDVCEGTDLPTHFTAKILRDLVRAGLLVSARGSHGGYALARDAIQISLYDIVNAIEGVQQYSRCVTCLSKCDDNQPCAQHDAFKPLRAIITQYLRNTTLAHLSDPPEAADTETTG